MYALLDKIDAIEAKAKELIFSVESLKHEKDVLLRENVELHKELKRHKDKIEELTLAQVSDATYSDDIKADLRKEIAGLKEEVEECIKLTHNI